MPDDIQEPARPVPVVCFHKRTRRLHGGMSHFFQHPHSIYLFRSEKIGRLLFVFRKESANMKKKKKQPGYNAKYWKEIFANEPYNVFFLFILVHKEQNVERHCCSIRHRCQLIRGLHSQEALRQEPLVLRVPLWSRWHRPQPPSRASRRRLEEEKGRPRSHPAATSSTFTRISGLEGLDLVSEQHQLGGRISSQCHYPRGQLQQ